MPDPSRFTQDEMLRLAASAVAKVDLMGARGTTLCTMDEIEAMATLLAVSGLLPDRPAPDQHHPVIFATKEDYTHD
ncbi:hypothetical protein [Loktanella sp. 3ANDIMAR09]|uniref:hypothetical protein n=1 Tax=Loktanella sp. 3ANDIMAR09 TaxID=1225657 RepID=UPI000A5CBD4B|nr:hypothetical protein [Loktanella sp. 3ANDIMAR09]